MNIPTFSSNFAFGDKYFLSQYDDNILRITHQKYCKNKGFEELEDNFKQDTNDIIDLNDENINSINASISRAKRSIREYALTNHFEYFVTITVASKNADRFSLTECQELLRKTLKSYKRKNKDFGYVLITEKHEKGSFHFHGFFKGINDDDLIEINLINFNRLPYKILQYIEDGEKLYTLKHFDQKMGWFLLSKIKHIVKATNYIMKYITKDCIRNEKGYFYFNSRGLKRPLHYEILPIDLSYFGDKVFKNDYCEILDINLNEITQDMKLFLQYNIQDKNNLFEFFKKAIDF